MSETPKVPPPTPCADDLFDLAAAVSESPARQPDPAAVGVVSAAGGPAQISGRGGKVASGAPRPGFLLPPTLPAPSFEAGA
jgi:hypothetical protein